MSRRRLAAVAAALALAAVPAAADETLTVATWGGAYEAAQRAALFDPFEAATGIRVETAAYQGGIEALRGADGWDIVDMIESDARRACAAGLLQRMDAAALAAPAPDGASPQVDFVAGAFGECGLAHLVFSTVIAYDDRAFPGIKPRRVRDFFDVERFPGKRALRKTPTAVLEWALMAEGVPISQVYDLLSTDRGIALALRRLERLRGHILWWQDAAEPAALLHAGEAVMASGFNGRFFDAQVADDAPIVVIWDGQIVDSDVWAIPAGADDVETARRFIRFATHPARLAALAERIPYGPARASALDRIGLHPTTRAPMRAHLPTAPRHLERALRADSDWYASTEALRRRRFERWLAAGEE